MKKPLLSLAASLFAWALVMPPIEKVTAAELKVIAGGSMTGSLNEIGPQFERASGHKLTIHFDSTPNIIARVTSGTPFDLAVVPVDVFKDAAAKARFVPSPTTDIARVGYGVVVRSGAPKPDISTPDALKKTLLDASSVAFVPASAAGAYVLKVFDRLGIAEAMKAKTKAQADAGRYRPGRRQGRSRTRGVSRQRADRPRCRTRRLRSPRSCSRIWFSPQPSPRKPRRRTPPRPSSTI